MANYFLIKTMKIRDDLKSGDWTKESDWMWIDPETIHKINIFGKMYTDENTGGEMLTITCRDCENYKEAKNGCNGFCKEWKTSTYSWEWCSRGAKKDEVEE